ncbi:imelysin family protein [Cyclobacterium sp.]|uniref:imelysin family protein n=1 Tax=Cyclobacterium sp. TaxID=1966343 RepID=UPI00199581EA|nr:imelysin family protein [Cyclobacterium sp.]MBD3627466.1 imelysin family protein [Cyclobacterium sp.]
MRFKHLLGSLILVTGLIGLLPSCVENSGEENQEVTARKPVLENLANTVIIPGYENLLAQMTLLDQAVNNFTGEPNQAHLTALRADFENTYSQWQKVSFLEFGPAFSQTLRAEFNTFPTDNFSIDNAIESGEFSLTGFSTTNRRGLPAMDYLIYGLADSDEEVIEKYSTDVNSGNRKEYLMAVSQLILNKIDLVYNQWVPSGGNYQEEFIQKDGTDVGSSFGEMVNALSQYLERFSRDARMGIPLGKRSQGVIIPRNVEAYYSQKSIPLLKAHISGMKDFYLGNREGNEGKGFYDFLIEIKTGEDEGLAQRILDQFDLILSRLDQVPSPLSATIQNNPAPAEAAHLELQKQVILIKTEFSSALGVLITYQDNDGD